MSDSTASTRFSRGEFSKVAAFILGVPSRCLQLREQVVEYLMAIRHRAASDRKTIAIHAHTYAVCKNRPIVDASKTYRRQHKGC